MKADIELITLRRIAKYRSLMQKARSLLMAFMGLWTLSASACGIADELEGVYISPGRATAQKDKDGPFVEVNGATDCLVIKRSGDEKVEIYLSSIQERGYSCYLEGNVVVEGGRLFYPDPDAKDPNQKEGVYIDKSANGRIKLSYFPRPSMHYCGIHGDLRTVAFDLSKRERPWQSVTQEPKKSLSEYCPAWNR